MTVKGLFVNATEIRDLNIGEVIFTAGEPGTEMFGVISGKVELRRHGHVVASVEADGTFGELAIIDYAPRSLDAVAAAPSRVAVIDEKTFLFLVHETPMFALNVMRALAARIKQIDEAGRDGFAPGGAMGWRMSGPRHTA